MAKTKLPTAPVPALTDFNTDPTTMTSLDAMMLAFFNQDPAGVMGNYKAMKGSSRIMACAKIVADALAGLGTQTAFVAWIMPQLDPNDVNLAQPILDAYQAGDLDGAWVMLNRLPGAVPIAVLQTIGGLITSNDDTTAFFNWVQRIS